MPTQANTTARYLPPAAPPPAVDNTVLVSNVAPLVTRWGVGGGGSTGGVTISDIAPAAPAVGDLWWDSLGGQLYVWYTDPNTSQWVIAVNSGGGPPPPPYVLPPATTTVLGGVTVDGTTISANGAGQISTIGGPFLPLAAGSTQSLTGELYVPIAAPTQPQVATNRQYVDDQDAALQAEIDLLASNLLFAGVVNATTGAADFTIASGLPDGPLPAAGAGNANRYVIVSVAGPGGVAALPLAAWAVGDWAVSDGTAWVRIPTGQAAVTAPQVAMNPVLPPLGPTVQSSIAWLDTNKVDLAGDTMTGPLNISGAAGTSQSVFGQTAGVNRWQLSLGDNAAESGGNNGSDLTIQCYDNTGTLIARPLHIYRSNGGVTFSSTVNATGAISSNSNVTAGANVVGTGVIGTFLYSNGGFIRVDGVGSSERGVRGTTTAIDRWRILLADASPETGANSGSDFAIRSYDDTSTAILPIIRGTPLSIERATDICTFAAPIVETSDAALKENVAPVQDALDIVSQLQGVYYNTGKSAERQIGLIAQDVQSALPEVVFTTPGRPPSEGDPGSDPMLGVAYGRMVAVLVNAVKELSAKVAVLEAARGS